MAYRLNHIHLKANDPKKVADWYVKAFDFAIESDTVRPTGDRFLRCRSGDGAVVINISGARTGEPLGPADPSIHAGLEHLAFDSDDMEADIAKLKDLGAVIQDGPIATANGGKMAFIATPDGVRIELLQIPSAM